ncbi:MAG: YlbE-like family protein [Sporolactobacillus sp.]
MRRHIQDYLDQHLDEKIFVRLHPAWYRTLSRRPETLNELKTASDQFYGRTFRQRVDRFNEQAGLFSMLMAMAQGMGGSSRQK